MSALIPVPQTGTEPAWRWWQGVFPSSPPAGFWLCPHGARQQAGQDRLGPGAVHRSQGPGALGPGSQVPLHPDSSCPVPSRGANTDVPGASLSVAAHAPRWPSAQRCSSDRQLVKRGRGGGAGGGRSLTQAVSGVGRCQVVLGHRPSDSIGRHWPSSVGISPPAHVGRRCMWRRKFLLETRDGEKNDLGVQHVLCPRPSAP